jgi:hypothetical protein
LQSAIVTPDKIVSNETELIGLISHLVETVNEHQNGASSDDGTSEGTIRQTAPPLG